MKKLLSNWRTGSVAYVVPPTVSVPVEIACPPPAADIPVRCDPSPKKAEAVTEDRLVYVPVEPVRLIEPGEKRKGIVADPAVTTKLDPPTEKALPVIVVVPPTVAGPITPRFPTVSPKATVPDPPEIVKLDPPTLNALPRIVSEEPTTEFVDI